MKLTNDIETLNNTFHEMQCLMFNRKFVELQNEIVELVESAPQAPVSIELKKILNTGIPFGLDKMLFLVNAYRACCVPNKSDFKLMTFVDRLSLLSVRKLYDVCDTFRNTEVLSTQNRGTLIGENLIASLFVLAQGNKQLTNDLRISLDEAVVPHVTTTHQVGEEIIRSFDKQNPEIKMNMGEIVIDSPVNKFS